MVALVPDFVLGVLDVQTFVEPFLRQVLQGKGQLGYQVACHFSFCRNNGYDAIGFEQEPVHEEQQHFRSGARLSRLFQYHVRLVAADWGKLHQGQNLPLVSPCRETDYAVLVLYVSEFRKVENVVLALDEVVFHILPRVFTSRRNCRLAEALLKYIFPVSVDGDGILCYISGEVSYEI